MYTYIKIKVRQSTKPNIKTKKYKAASKQSQITKRKVGNNTMLKESTQLAIQIMTHYHIPFSFSTIDKMTVEIEKAIKQSK